MQEALCAASMGSLCRGETDVSSRLKERNKEYLRCRENKSYATVVGLCRGLYADFFFLAFFGAGPELSEDPAREDSVAACFRSGPLGPLVLGGTSCTWPSGSADVEDSGYENAIEGVECHLLLL